jgi:hypothetical protein
VESWSHYFDQELQAPGVTVTRRDGHGGRGRGRRAGPLGPGGGSVFHCDLKVRPWLANSELLNRTELRSTVTGGPGPGRGPGRGTEMAGPGPGGPTGRPPGGAQPQSQAVAAAAGRGPH